jgi:hypothetical protein|tara:strand:- start:2787 stop:3347 length:561 start_codon:yes stop_codon:yes gene_type:complete
MAVASKYIKAVQKAAKGRPKSTEWYKDKIAEFGKPTTSQLIRDGRQSKSPFFGLLNMFIYAPKFGKKLPYYDTFPLVLPLEQYSDGFLGINLHYLPIPIRVRLLDSLGDFSNNEKFDATTFLRVNYNKVKNVKAVKPTIHKYLAGYVRSRFRMVSADEFTIATLLPVQRFKKASSIEVWRESRKMI